MVSFFYFHNFVSPHIFLVLPKELRCKVVPESPCGLVHLRIDEEDLARAFHEG